MKALVGEYRNFVVAEFDLRDEVLKLTLEQAREIKASADTMMVLAERFGVSFGAIQSIKNGRTWNHA